MKKQPKGASLVAVALAACGLATALPNASASASHSTVTHSVNVCTAHPKPGFASCYAKALADADGRLVQSSVPLAAFTPADIQKAYGLKGLESHGTVAIVDAYGYPTLEKDLAYFRKFYGLPKCTTKSGCLTIMGQDGGEPPTGGNDAWDLEQALDLDMVSSACPDCKIVIVESDYNSFPSLGAAVNQAATIEGVVSISNSYGAEGFDGRNRADYKHPGIAVLASTGDHGYQDATAPASYTSVIAVGGTSIVPDGSKRGFSETAWSGAGSGCSARNRNKPPQYQDTEATQCEGDAMADVSGPADPSNGGLSVYWAADSSRSGAPASRRR